MTYLKKFIVDNLSIYNVRIYVLLPLRVAIDRKGINISIRDDFYLSLFYMICTRFLI